MEEFEVTYRPNNTVEWSFKPDGRFFRTANFDCYLNGEFAFAYYLLLEEDPDFSAVSIWSNNKHVANLNIKTWKK